MSRYDRIAPTVRFRGLLLIPLALLGLGADRAAELPADVFAPAVRKPPAPMTGLAVYPPEVKLATARDRQSIVVQATFADGITRDVTKEATIEVANPKLVRRDGATFHPAADGSSSISVAYGGQKVAVPLAVAQATVLPPLSFRLDVMPVFMRAGCNTGSCHGAARGKDGFRISLFGFDPEGPAATACLDELAASGARLCLLALGAPKQEILAIRGAERLPGCGFVSVGAGLDFIAGHQSRAPVWVRRMALEWAWRLATNPRRLARRYLDCALVLPGLGVDALRERALPEPPRRPRDT